MVRINMSERHEDGFQYVELAGLSTDNKPTNADFETGSVFIEVDTGDVYLYNEVTPSWVKIGGDDSE